MAFTLDQNVEGAASYAPAQRATPSVGLGLAGVALDALSTFSDNKYRQEKAAATASKGTQTDRDRTLFTNLVRKAQSEVSSGVSPDAVSAKYSTEFANLGLNEQQRAVVTGIFGEDIFAVPVQVQSQEDVVANLFNERPVAVQLGLIELEKQAAAKQGTTISDEEAAQRAVASLATTTAQSQASLQAGNFDFAKGFQGNMETLDRLSSALTAALNVEAKGGNFDLSDLAELEATYQTLKTQRAFMKPSGTLNSELWEQMDTKLKAMEGTFEALKDYDSKQATAQAKALVANIALNVSETNPLAILAMQSPEQIESIAAKLAPDFTEEMSKNGGELNNVVGFSDLGFGTSVQALIDNEEVTVETLSGSPDLFPASLKESYSEVEGDNEKLKTNLNLQRPIMTAFKPQEVLNNPASKEAWASTVSNMSYLIQGMSVASTANLDALFSAGNLSILRELRNGGDPETAKVLEAQMGAALRQTSATYTAGAVGTMQRFKGLVFNPKSLKMSLDKSPEFEGINAVVDLYYDGDFENLWKEGPAAQENLKLRLASRGLLTPDSPEFQSFLAATKSIDISEPEATVWKGIAPRYKEVIGITDRLIELKGYGEALKLDLNIGSSFDTEEIRKSLDESAIASGEILRSELGKQGTTPETAYKVTTQEDMDAVPVGGMYINPADGRVYTKKGTE
jgi:hypothetical protein